MASVQLTSRRFQRSLRPDVNNATGIFVIITDNDNTSNEDYHPHKRDIRGERKTMVVGVTTEVGRCAYKQPIGMQIGSRASKVSGSWARASNPAATISFLEMDSAGIGVAKAGAAARRTRSVSVQLLERIAMTLLTESKEGSEDTGELHCGCYDGGFFFFCKRQSEWAGFDSRSNGEGWRDWSALPALKYGDEQPSVKNI